MSKQVQSRFAVPIGGIVKLLWVLCILTAVCGDAWAAEIGYTKEGRISLFGEIRAGDTAKAIALLRANPLSFIKSPWALNSNGGDIVEAIRLGELIKDLYQSVEVLDYQSKCASACFFVYISAVNRMAFANTLGIHRPYFDQRQYSNLDPDTARKKYDELASKVRAFMKQNDVPNDLVEKMFSLASDEIYWVSSEDDDKLGQRPYWFDQYMVSKCGFNSRKYFDAVTRLRRGSESERPQILRWTNCEVDTTMDRGLENAKKYLKYK